MSDIERLLENSVKYLLKIKITSSTPQFPFSEFGVKLGDFLLSLSLSALLPCCISLSHSPCLSILSLMSGYSAVQPRFGWETSGFYTPKLTIRDAGPPHKLPRLYTEQAVHRDPEQKPWVSHLIHRVTLRYSSLYSLHCNWPPSFHSRGQHGWGRQGLTGMMLGWRVDSISEASAAGVEELWGQETVLLDVLPKTKKCPKSDTVR